MANPVFEAMHPEEVSRDIYTESEELGTKVQQNLPQTAKEMIIANDTYALNLTITTQDDTGAVSGFAVVGPGVLRTIRADIARYTIQAAATGALPGNGYATVITYCAPSTPWSGWGNALEGATGQGTVPTGTGNTVTVGGQTLNMDNPTAAGLALNMHVAGQYANNTININPNGSGLVTSIHGQSMLGSNIDIDEGDTVAFGSMVNAGIVSRNEAGGLQVISQGATGGLGVDDDQVQLFASSAGTLVWQMNNMLNGSCTAYYTLDGGPQIEVCSPAGSGTSYPVSTVLGAGNHTLLLVQPNNFDEDNPGFQTVSWSSGPISGAPLGQPSNITVGTMVEAGIKVYGSSINIGNMTGNAQIFEVGGAATQGSSIDLVSMDNATITFSSPISIKASSLKDAIVTVPSGVAAPTIIQYSGTIAEDLTTSAAQTAYVGADLIPGYVAPTGPGFAVGAASLTAAGNITGATYTAPVPGQMLTRMLVAAEFIAGLAAPLTLAQASGSTSLAASTYYVGAALTNANGSTTLGDSLASIAVSTAGNVITTSVTLPALATGLDLFVGTTDAPLELAAVSASGAITYAGGLASGLAATVSGSTISLTISAAASSTGTAPATVNTTAAPLIVSETYTPSGGNAITGQLNGGVRLEPGQWYTFDEPLNAGDAVQYATGAAGIISIAGTLKGVN